MLINICDLCLKEFVDGRGCTLEDNKVICNSCYIDYGESVKTMCLKDFKEVSA